MLGPVLAEAFKLDECRQHYLAGPLQEQPGLRRDLLVGAGDSRGYLETAVDIWDRVLSTTTACLDPGI